MHHEWIVLGGTIGGLLVLAGLLHALKRLGPLGRALGGACSRAPMLDLIVYLFTVVPPLAGLAHGLFWQLGAVRTTGLFFLGIAGQVIALILWTILHELRHRARTRNRPRIVTQLNHMVGPVQNFVAVYWTALAVPIFAFIRLGELIIYPPLTWLVKLPKYRMGQWVNVSRQKFDGLVGHDLIWCLYCDWMTGVWSLGSEMLRNIESFWCPIRFGNKDKCENCKLDFPDVIAAWAPADSSIERAAGVLKEQYPGPDGTFSWFGHPSRGSGAGRNDTPTPLTRDGRSLNP